MFSLNLSLPLGGVDFDQIWLAAHALLEGRDPYQVVRPPQFRFPLFYPLTSAVAVLPLGWLDYRAARLVFVLVSGGVFGYAIGRHRPWLWPTFLGIPFILFASGGQWSALLAAAVLLPWLGPLAAAKPNLGLAVLAAVKTWKAGIILLGGSFLLLCVSVVLDPAWSVKWNHALDQSSHFRPLIIRPGGFLLLLALLRWYDRDARLVLALGLIPTTGLPYDMLPAALVARNRAQAALLTILTQMAWLIWPAFPPVDPYADWSWRTGTVTLWSALLPALFVVLERGPRRIFLRTD